MLRGLLAAEGRKTGRRHGNTDAEDGDRSALSASANDEARTRPQDPPYLLRGMTITQPNQVWAMDVTYIPMARGFVYLAVVLNWATRRVLSRRLSITMKAVLRRNAGGRLGSPRQARDL